MSAGPAAATGGGRVDLTDPVEPRRPRGRGASGGRGVAVGPADRRRVYWTFLLPAILLYTGVFVIPSLAGIVLSLGRWRGPGDTFRWAGLANFRRLVGDEAFRVAFLNTSILLVVGGIGVFAVTFLAMVVLREMRGQAFIRSVLFLPAVISIIAIGSALGFILNPDGALNRLLTSIGADGLRQVWLGPDLIFKVILVGFVWLSTGFYIVLFMSAVDSIPAHLYEDARLAGATKVQQFRYITLPLTWDVFSIAAVLWVIGGLKVFDIVIAFVGTTGSPPVEARTIAFEQYLVITKAQDLGYGAAIGVAIFLLTLALVILIRRVTRREALQLS